MRNKFDQLVKAILTVLLRDTATVETGREIPGHVEIADLWVEPNEDRSKTLPSLGLLGRMIELGPCLLEPFSQVPRTRDIRSCILKQYALAHAQAREAQREARPLPPFPRLWIISSGHPATMIKQMELRPVEGWPDGIWRGREFDAFYLVAVRLLPKRPETLFMRLLGRGPTFRHAVRELVTNPNGRWALELLQPVLIAFRREISQAPIEEEDMDALRELEAVYADWERRVHNDGERTGLIEGIEVLCAAFDIELSKDRRQQLASWDVDRLKELLNKLGTLRKWPSIA